MRYAFAILLLLTAAVHPLVHFSDVMNDCPCVHGAVTEVVPPAAAPAVVSGTCYVCAEPMTPRSGALGDVPARAPPVA